MVNAASKTPLNRASSNCLSMNLQQSSKRRLSLSPAVTNYLNKFNTGSPSVANNSMAITSQALNAGTSGTSTTAATSSSGHLTLHSHHTHLHLNYIHIHRNFSPMAALSRSPSCSSSPAVLSLGPAAANNTSKRSLIPLPTLPGSAAINTSIVNTNFNTNNNIHSNAFMTPSIECKTPSNNQYCQQTPSNNNNVTRTPFVSNNNNDLIEDNSTDNEPISELALECIWNEQPGLIKFLEYFFL